MSRVIGGALILGGALLAFLAPSYNGQWVWGVLAMLGGLGVLYVTAEEP